MLAICLDEYEMISIHLKEPLEIIAQCVFRDLPSHDLRNEVGEEGVH